MGRGNDSSRVAARHGSRWPIVLVVVLGPIVPGLALAQSTASDDEVVHLCYVPEGGSVYRVDAPDLREECAGKHVAFDVNAQDPQGEQGPQGDPGPVMGWERVAATVTVTSADPRQNVTAKCPEGKVATGGGYQLAPSEDVRIVFSLPSADGSGWGIDAQLQSGTNGSATAVAVCVEG